MAHGVCLDDERSEACAIDTRGRTLGRHGTRPTRDGFEAVVANPRQHGRQLEVASPVGRCEVSGSSAGNNSVHLAKRTVVE